MIEFVPRAATRNGEAEASLEFLGELLSGYRPRDFGVRLWDGTTWDPPFGEEARFTLVLRHPGALRAMFWPPKELTLAEAFLYDDFDVEGDLEAVFPLADHLLVERRLGAAARLRQARHLLSLPGRARAGRGEKRARLRGRRFSRERDRRAIAYHYDRSNAFFGLVLDDQMVYSCAYFGTSEEGLNAAQERKLDYICRKLRLRPGERLLDIGCGWGALVMHAAERYGVEAVGITLSREQAVLARERVRMAGLDGLCRIELCDYRELDQVEEYDKLVSVGMVEHVAQAELSGYFARARRLLRPGGVFLNHGIACAPGYKPRRGRSFIGSYVFPDHHLSPIGVTLGAAAGAGLEVRDVENLRDHYVLTLRRWRERLEARADDVRQATDEVHYRVWRLYLAGSAHGFASGRLNIFQTLLVKTGARSGLPLTRADWYS